MDFIPLPEVASDASAFNLLTGARNMVSSAVFQPGTTLGPYTLLEKLGDGGFATVWSAAQEEPVQRDVAVKLLKVGQDSLDVMARFDQESRALALMDHPNIAKVHDAGTMTDGRPFFVMELVSGEGLNHYVDHHPCPLDQRLSLMIEICAGVQHAHQKGIIHRDLKPSNILVTQVDGRATPKIIDFGIAKAVCGEGGTGLGSITLDNHLIGTPLYMSPEQAEGTGDIDTRSDVYALGAILYELLTGHPPFQPQLGERGCLMELRRQLREVEPAPPSSASTLGGVGRDLDLITLKALSKDRDLRYPSASALGDDLRRHLRHEPVEARPPTFGYVIQRWVRRHRTAAVAGILCLTVVMAGMTSTMWHKRKAEAGARQATAVLDMLLGLLANSDVLRKGSDTEVAALIVKIGREAAKFPANNRRLMRLEEGLALTYIGLGNSGAAVPHLRRAEAAALTCGANADELFRIRRLLMAKLAIHPARAGDALQLVGRLLPEYPAARERALLLGWKAEAELQLQRPGEALETCLEALAISDAADPPLHPRDVLEIRYAYPRSLRTAGQVEAGLHAAEENVILAESSSEIPEEDLATAVAGLGLELYRLRDYPAARQAFHRALALRTPRLGRDHALTLSVEDNLIGVTFAMGRTEDALAQRRDQFVALCDEVGLQDARTLNRFTLLLSGYRKAGQSGKALELIESTLAPHCQSDGSFCDQAIPLLHRTVGYFRDCTEWGLAEKYARSLLAALLIEQPDAYLTALAQGELARALHHLGRHDEARAEAAAAVQRFLPYQSTEPEVDSVWLPLLSNLQQSPDAPP